MSKMVSANIPRDSEFVRKELAVLRAAIGKYPLSPWALVFNLRLQPNAKLPIWRSFWGS